MKETVLEIFREYIEGLKIKCHVGDLTTKEMETLERILKILSSVESNMDIENEFESLSISELKKIAGQYTKS